MPDMPDMTELEPGTDTTSATTMQHNLAYDKDMQVTAVCIGAEEPIEVLNKSTGLFKKPVAGPVYVGTEQLEGDVIVDRKHHGGPMQAVYIFGGEDYAWWNKELGRELEFGNFGENLCISGLNTHDVLVGDCLIFNEVTLAAVSPRIPCLKLGTRMGDRLFGKRFMASGHTGFYCRVLKTGNVQAGEKVKLAKGNGSEANVKIIDLIRRR